MGGAGGRVREGPKVRGQVGEGREDGRGSWRKELRARWWRLIRGNYFTRICELFSPLFICLLDSSSSFLKHNILFWTIHFVSVK